MIGDFNLPDINWKSKIFLGDFKSQMFLTFLNDGGFVQYIEEGTRKANTLDLLCCNDSLLIADYSVTLPFHNSDHESIELIIFVEDIGADSLNFKSSEFAKNLWHKADWYSFASFLSPLDWAILFPRGATVDELWDCFCTILLQGIDCFVPTTTGVTSLKVHHSWGVKKLMSKRRTFWRLKRSSPTNINVKKYNTATVTLNAALLDEAASKELKIIKSGNIGQFYKHVNSRLHHKSGIAPLMKPGGTILYL